MYIAVLLQAEEAKSFDFWTFKKALLSTLLQAVKAIKGGIIAIKGQIIKAKGHLLSTKGRIISAKGEAISNFGKQLANTALNLDAPKTSSAPTASSAGYSYGPTGSAGKV
jgi:ribosomal protein S4